MSAMDEVKRLQRAAVVLGAILSDDPVFVYYAVRESDPHMHLRIELGGMHATSWSSNSCGVGIHGMAYLDRCSEYREDPDVDVDDLVFVGWAVRVNGLTIKREWFVVDPEALFACGWAPGDQLR